MRLGPSAVRSRRLPAGDVDCIPFFRFELVRTLRRLFIVIFEHGDVVIFQPTDPKLLPRATWLWGERFSQKNIQSVPNSQIDFCQDTPPPYSEEKCFMRSKMCNSASNQSALENSHRSARNDGFSFEIQPLGADLASFEVDTKLKLILEKETWAPGTAPASVWKHRKNEKRQLFKGFGSSFTSSKTKLKMFGEFVTWRLWGN